MTEARILDSAVDFRKAGLPLPFESDNQYVPVWEPEILSKSGYESLVHTESFSHGSATGRYVREPSMAVRTMGWVEDAHFRAVLDVEYGGAAGLNIAYGPFLEMLYMSKSRGATMVSLAARLALSAEAEFPSTFMVGVWDNGDSRDINETIESARKVITRPRGPKVSCGNSNDISEDVLYNYTLREYGGSVYHGIGSILLKISFDKNTEQITTETQEIEHLEGNVSTIILPYRGLRGQ